MEIKRSMTLVASIIATVFLSIDFIVEIISIAILSDLAREAGTTIPSTIIAAFVIAMAFIVITLIFNILNIRAWIYTAEKFRKNIGIYITALVFVLFIALLSIISLIESDSIVWTIVYMVAMVASGTLYIVDLCLENKRVLQFAQTEASTEDNNNANELSEKSTTKTELEAKLEKLSNMLENKLIDEKEYAELKKKYIQEELNK